MVWNYNFIQDIVEYIDIKGGKCLGNRRVKYFLMVE